MRYPNDNNRYNLCSRRVNTLIDMENALNSDIGSLEEKLKLLQEQVERCTALNDKLQRKHNYLVSANFKLKQKNKHLYKEGRVLFTKNELLTKDLLLLEHKSTLLEIRGMVNAYLKTFTESNE